MGSRNRIRDFTFPEPLIEGIIVVRRNRFVIDVKLDEEVHVCHCPCTGKIGNFDLRGRPCLLSRGTGTKRKTQYTMEAVSLDEPEVEHKSWIGVNQNAMNRYVEHYLVQGGFGDMVRDGGEVQREVSLGNSKIDFRVGNVFIEVKSPIWRIELEIPDHIQTYEQGTFNSYERLLKHLNSLVSELEPYQRAIMLVCLGYDTDSDGWKSKVTKHRSKNRKVQRMFEKCDFLELWQANFRLTKQGVRLLRYFPVEVE